MQPAVETVGRSVVPLQFEVKRPLVPADLTRRQNAVLGSKTPPLTRIRDRHHRVAVYMVQGHKDEEISAMTGYSPSRLSVLKNDPAFQELLAYYRDRQKEIYVEVEERMKDLSLTALSVLIERIEERPEEVADKDLLEISSRMLDRTGFGPTSKNVNLNANFSAEQVAALKKEAAKHINGNVKTITQEATPILPTQDREGTAVGRTLSVGADPAEAEAEGESSEGKDLRKEGGSGTSEAAE